MKKKKKLKKLTSIRELNERYVKLSLNRICYVFLSLGLQMDLKRRGIEKDEGRDNKVY
jgi:hypothetical protein